METSSAIQLLLLFGLHLFSLTETLSVRPVLRVSPHSWPVVGDSVTLTCEVPDTSLNWRYIWYRVRGDAEEAAGEAPLLERLPESSAGAGRSYNLSHAALKHTGLYVCRAEGGDPAYQTEFSDLGHLWVIDALSSASAVRPRRTQHFSNHSLLVSCSQTVFQCRLIWKTGRPVGPLCPGGWVKEDSWSTSACSIKLLSQEDSGVYWYQSEHGRSKTAFNITVTDGDMILDSPVYPPVEGLSLTLRCLSRSSGPVPGAELYKDGSLLQTLSTGEMTILEASKAHEGSYKCSHPELGESPEAWVTVTHNDPSSEFSTLTLLRNWGTVGDSVTLSCEVEDSSLNWTFLWYRAVPFREDLPFVQHKWKPYSAELLSDSSRGAGGSYTLSPAALKHTGLYVCRAETGDPPYQTGFSHVEPLWITGTSPPASLIVRPNRAQHFESASLSLRCETQDSSTGWRLRWLTRRAEGAECPRGWSSGRTGSTCTTRGVSKSDSGLYWCESETEEFSSGIKIQVTGGDLVLESPVHPLPEGSSMVLSCFSQTANITIEAEFYKDDRLLDVTDEMIIPAVSKADEGNYTCKSLEEDIFSQEESLDTWIFISHNGSSPVLSTQPSLRVSPHSWPAEGDSVTLSCEVGDASLNWTFLWYRAVPYRQDLPSLQYRKNHYSAELLSDSSRGAGGSYTLSPAALKHTGLYVCRAEGGDPTYQTKFSDVKGLWVSGVSPPVSLVVRPNRSQHFIMDHLSLSCEAHDSSTRWSLRWLSQRNEGHECPDWWESNTESTYRTAASLPLDNGVYWCQSETAAHSNTVNITVTNVDVILESPAHPVTEGDPLTLRCTFRSSPSNFSADFYKDGSLLQTRTTGEMNIPVVSKAHEGSYKCSHPELGASPESWVKVINPTGSRVPVMRLVCSLLVVSPYLLVTIVLLSQCGRANGPSNADEEERKYENTTELDA